MGFEALHARGSRRSTHASGVHARVVPCAQFEALDARLSIRGRPMRAVQLRAGFEAQYVRPGWLAQGSGRVVQLLGGGGGLLSQHAQYIWQAHHRRPAA